MLAPRSGDPLPFGSVPYPPYFAFDSPLYDVADRGCGHAPAAVAVEASGAKPVAAGDSAEREDPLQEFHVDLGSLSVVAGCTATHGQIVRVR